MVCTGVFEALREGPIPSGSTNLKFYSCVPELVAGEGLLILWRKPTVGSNPTA